jgi:voltage-gated potassium channel
VAVLARLPVVLAGDEPRLPTRLDRWTTATEWPLIMAALAFLAAYAWPILDRGLSPAAVATWDAITWVTWGLFALDYVVRVALTTHRRRYVVRHLHDLAVIALPLLRPLRLLRLVTVVGALNRRAGASLRGRVAVYVVGTTTLLSAVAGLAMLDAERDAAEANITTIGDALWWSVATITTVGYGDRYPVTTAGRVIALGLMLTGIALLGVITATLASWIIERVNVENAADRAATVAHVEALMEEIRALRRERSEEISSGCSPLL